MTKSRSILTQYQQLTLDTLQREAHRRYNTPIAAGDGLPDAPWTARALVPATVYADKEAFYRQVDSSVLAQLVENVLDKPSFNNLLLDREKFLFTCAGTGQVKYDGPTMLFPIYQVIDPNIIVGLDNIVRDYKA